MYDIYTCMIQNRKMIHIFFGCISCCRMTEHGSYYQALAFIEVSHTQIKHILCTFYITYLCIHLFVSCYSSAGVQKYKIWTFCT